MKDSPMYFKLGPDRIKAKQKDTPGTFSESFIIYYLRFSFFVPLPSLPRFFLTVLNLRSL